MSSDQQNPQHFRPDNGYGARRYDPGSQRSFRGAVRGGYRAPRYQQNPDAYANRGVRGGWRPRPPRGGGFPQQRHPPRQDSNFNRRQVSPPTNNASEKIKVCKFYNIIQVDKCTDSFIPYRVLTTSYKRIESTSQTSGGVLTNIERWATSGEHVAAADPSGIKDEGQLHERNTIYSLGKQTIKATMNKEWTLVSAMIERKSGVVSKAFTIGKALDLPGMVVSDKCGKQKKGEKVSPKKDKKKKKKNVKEGETTTSENDGKKVAKTPNQKKERPSISNEEAKKKVLSGEMKKSTYNNMKRSQRRKKKASITKDKAAVQEPTLLTVETTPAVVLEND